jgi:hypothetical protein
VRGAPDRTEAHTCGGSTPQGAREGGINVVISGHGAHVATLRTEDQCAPPAPAGKP